MNSMNYLKIVLLLCFVIAVEVESNEILRKIVFKRSKLLVIVQKQINDTRYLAKLYNGEQFLQTLYLGKSSENPNISVGDLSNGVELFTNSNFDSIQFIVAIDVEGFSVLEILRKLKTNEKVTDCFDLESENMNWYGGPQDKIQLYPVQEMKFKDHPFISLDGTGVMERYWLNSRGLSVTIPDDTPLFVDQNTIVADHICFTAKNTLPYHIQKETYNFRYRIGFSNDAKTTQMNNMHRYARAKPNRRPNDRLVKYPTWNTWVRYGRNIDEKTITEFMSEISMNKFNYSLLVIDDFWEEKCYGSMKIDTVKFPNMKKLTTELKKKYDGLGISLWIHPYINKNCDPYYALAVANDYLVKSMSGSHDTSWWNSGTNEAALIDLSNVKAANWFRNHLIKLKQDSGIDTFKFVGFEAKFLTGSPNTTGSRLLVPAQVKQEVIIADKFGDMMEFSSGRRTQHLNAFVRMHGFNSRWTIDNGLKALIPRLIQMNLASYHFILPDYVGGNRYGDDITKELFIRWLQATVFMPGIQFSVTPWDFDEETVAIAKKFTNLHLEYSEFILQRFKSGITKRDPVNLPIWWIDPQDKVAQKVADQFLLGETILSAPIVDRGKKHRDIYLPEGYWKDGNNGSIYQGKRWLKNYPAPIDVLPYFINQFNPPSTYNHIEVLQSYTFIKQFYFKRSKVSFTIQKFKADGKYYMKIFNGIEQVQIVSLNTNFSSLEFKEVQNGFELFAANNLIRITIDVDIEDFSVLNIQRNMTIKDVATDCFSLEPKNMNWYGGGYTTNAVYPIQKMKYSLSYYSVRGGRYWLNSRGVFIYINHDIPLFVDQNSKIADNICFTAKNGPPYRVSNIFHFNYKIGFSSNARRTQMNFNHRYFRTKWSIPNDRVIRYPHWGTPYIFKSRIDETLFRGYTDNIAKYGLKASTIMIDSDAQDCMGSNSMDKKRFPNMENLVADIKKKIQGVVFAMQLHPFINESCLPNYEIARKNNYFINFVPPTGMDKLWNPFHKTSVQIDFQNPSATEWLKKELIRFKQETGIDTFSYGSQINYLDTIEDPYENQYLPFDLASTNLMKLEKEFMNPYRLRNGWQDQDLKELSHSHYTFEFIDFKNNWSSKDGLKSMIPFLMQANLHGNPYIIQECFRHKTDEANKELFIRYVQTTAFFPNINYCIGPWEFDQETVDITKKMNKLHEDYTDLILERIKLSFDRGDPINPPIWWIDPEDKDAQMVSDEYLLGETVLVAPVIEKGMTKRDIYLPIGSWKDGNTGKVHEGKTWLRNYDAPLKVLPFFIKQTSLPFLFYDAI